MNSHSKGALILASLFERVGEYFSGASPSAGELATADLAEQLAESWDIAIEKRIIPTETLGSTGVEAPGGFVIDMDRVRARQLSGTRRYDEYELILRNVAIVAAGVRLYLNVLSKAEWTMNPAEDQEQNPRAQEIADTAYDMMFDMTSPWSSVVRKTAMYRFNGFSILEWTAKKREDGQIGMLDVENRPQRTITRWDLDDNGTVKGCWQMAFGKPEIYLPRGKVIYAVDDSLTESPEGYGLFDHLQSIADKLKGFTELEELGFETDLRGMPVARAPLGDIQNQKANHGIAGETGANIGNSWAARMTAPLRTFIRGHVKNRKQGLLLDSETYKSVGGDSQAPSPQAKWSVELLQGQSTSFDAIANAINREIEQAARIMGVEHLLLGKDGSGSLALSKTKQSGFYLTVTSTLLDMVEIYERDWLQPLADMNGWPDELVPSMGVEEISESDVVELVDAISKLATAGAPLLPNDPVIGEIRDMFGVSRPPDEAMDMDASLLAEPDAEEDIPDVPEDVEKRQRIRKWITSRRSKKRMARAKQRGA